jgi:hypothetical protein
MQTFINQAWKFLCDAVLFSAIYVVAVFWAKILWIATKFIWNLW